MEKSHSIFKAYRSFFLSVFLFMCLIAISFLNEFLDLPHYLFGFKSTPVNVPEMLFEMITLLVFGAILSLIILSSIKQQNKNHDLVLSSLNEKEYLLKEIHHRIKNNLALIASIVRLQAHSISDQQLKIILSSLENRIHSIALIHEKIYLSDDLNTVHLESYFTDLINEILSISEKRIDLELHVDPLNLEQKNIIPIALITNELVTNSLKYAFANEASPRIWLSFTKFDNHYCLKIGNNGAPLPENFSIQQTTSLGLTIVNSLVNQISGELMIVSAPYTEIAIKFPAG